jgi:hypothetical protein
MSRLALIASTLLMVVLIPSMFPIAAADAPLSTSKTTRRCGWFENPTPGNVTLSDRDGEWEISKQAGHEASGNLPTFDDEQWVTTNSGGHGYGCACMSMKADTQSHEVSSFTGAKARPLAVCRRDHSLHEPAHPDES